MDVLVRTPGHYHLQNRAYFLASNFRHCMIIVSINYSLSLSLSFGDKERLCEKYYHYLLCTPPLSKDCSNTLLERSFLFSALREWNSLDKSIRKSDFNMFKKSVKTELFVQCYEC